MIYTIITKLPAEIKPGKNSCPLPRYPFFALFAGFRRIVKKSPAKPIPDSPRNVCQEKEFNIAYYETFCDFNTGINDCLHRVETDYKNEIEKLLKPNFQDKKRALVGIILIGIIKVSQH